MKERGISGSILRSAVRYGGPILMGVVLASCAGSRGYSPFADGDQSSRVEGYAGLADPLAGTPVPLYGDAVAAGGGEPPQPPPVEQPAAEQPPAPQPAPEAPPAQPPVVEPPPVVPPPVEPPPAPEVPQTNVQVTLSGFPDTGPLLQLRQMTRYHDLAVPDGQGGTAFRAIALEEGFWYKDSVNNPDLFFPLDQYEPPSCAAGEVVILITSKNTPEQDPNGIVNRSLVALVPQDAPRGATRFQNFYAFAAHSLPVQGAGDSPFEPVRAYVSDQIRPGNQWVEVDGTGPAVSITVNGSDCNYRVAAVREWQYDPAVPAHFSMYDVRGLVTEFQP